MNTKQQGDIGVAKAIFIYTAMGYTVSIPNTDNSKYDLIIDNGELKRVQVKTTGYKTKNGIYQSQLRTGGGNQSWNGTHSKIDKANVDLVFILTQNGNCYEFPVDILHKRTTVNLGESAEQFKINIESW